MQTTRKRAMMHLEAIAAIGVIVVVLAGFGAAMLSLSRSNHALIARQQATLAAEAVLNRMREGRSPTDEQLAERFDDMKFRIERRAAEGDFVGFDVATVHIDAFTFGRKSASVRLDGIVPSEATP